jgi:hypothetical protein
MSIVKNIRTLATLTAGVLFLTACVTAPTPKNYSTFYSESPRSILVVPALNNTVSVTAADFFVSTVSRPFAERGYYVYPAYMVKRVLEDQGLSDAGLVHSADASRLGPLFGCDAVLFVEILRWESQYIVISTSTNVQFDYVLKSCKTGEELWRDTQSLTYSPQASNSGNPLADLLVQAIVSAIEKGAPNYIPLAQQANLLASSMPGHGLPAGPYLPTTYGQDRAQFPAGQ